MSIHQMNTRRFFTRLVYTSALFAITSFHSASLLADTPQGATAKSSPPAAKQPDPTALSPEQRKTFQEISKEMTKNMRASQTLHEEVRKIVESDTYDEKKLRQLIQKRHKEAEESIVTSSREMHTFYKSLSPEQKKRFDAIREQMKERHRNEMKAMMKEKPKADEKPAAKTDTRK